MGKKETHYCAVCGFVVFYKACVNCGADEATAVAEVKKSSLRAKTPIVMASLGVCALTAAAVADIDQRLAPHAVSASAWIDLHVPG